MRLSNVALPSALPWPPVLATRAPGAQSRRHAHHGMHVVIATEGALRFRTSGPWREAAGVVTPPDVPHEIDAREREVLLVFVDPESRLGAVLADALGSEVRAIDADARAAILDDTSPLTLMQSGAERWLERVIRALDVDAPARRKPAHPRIKRALALLGESGAAEPTLAELAGAVGLSPSRFMHAFTESVGIPLRPYVAWLRLQRAAASIVLGEPLARAAASAGYADAAHMTRSFRAMLGMTPSSLRPPAAVTPGRTTRGSRAGSTAAPRPAR